MSKKLLIVGAGITGITLAERLSKQHQVTVIDQRDHIGGNCYDYEDENGILIHKYGPHIFHTSNKKVWDYLSQFTDWENYQHKVLAKVDEKFIPVPFNLTSLKMCFPDPKHTLIEERLLKKYKLNSTITILKLMENKDPMLKELAEFIYQKIFLNYNMTQWGLKPDEIDPSVTARVPVVVSQDDRYFHDTYQGIPKNGYTAMFNQMLNNKNTIIKLSTKYQDIKDSISSDFTFYTGAIDSFFDFKFGKLNYRRLYIKQKTLDQKRFQPTVVVNYPNTEKFTKITEYKNFYPNKYKTKKTVITKEFPGNKGFLGWPTLDTRNKKRYKIYEDEGKNIKNTQFVGRLAEYRYYDMDDALLNALHVAEKYEK